MSSKDSGDSGGRYSEICGATNRNGEPCGLPAGWGTPGSQGGRCKFHGGSSTGPRDTSHLENNEFAVGNPGGGAPELNTNAQTAHGIWGDWRKVYERLPEDRTDYVDWLVAEHVDHCEPHTPDMGAEHREELALEYAVLGEIKRRIDYDLWAGIGENPPEDARGLLIEETVEFDGETYTVERLNPALDRDGSVQSRRWEIAKELSLLPGFQD